MSVIGYWLFVKQGEYRPSSKKTNHESQITFQNLPSVLSFIEASLNLLWVPLNRRRTLSMKPHHIRDVLLTREQIRERVHTMIEEIAADCEAENLVMLQNFLAYKHTSLPFRLS